MNCFSEVKNLSKISCRGTTGLRCDDCEEPLVVLEETTPIRLEMFLHRRKVIIQNNLVLIFNDFIL